MRTLTEKIKHQVVIDVLEKFTLTTSKISYTKRFWHCLSLVELHRLSVGIIYFVRTQNFPKN